MRPLSNCSLATISTIIYDSAHISWFVFGATRIFDFLLVCVWGVLNTHTTTCFFVCVCRRSNFCTSSNSPTLHNNNGKLTKHPTGEALLCALSYQWISALYATKRNAAAVSCVQHTSKSGQNNSKNHFRRKALYIATTTN